MTTKYKATAPDGTTFVITTKRPVKFAIFLKLDDGSYHPHFASTMQAAKNTWGTRGTGITKAIQEQD